MDGEEAQVRSIPLIYRNFHLFQRSKETKSSIRTTEDGENKEMLSPQKIVLIVSFAF